MPSFDDDDDNASGDNSSENDVDENMEDAEDQDVDMDAGDDDNDNDDGDPDGDDNDNEGDDDEDGDDGGDDDEQDDNDDDQEAPDSPSLPRPQKRSRSKAPGPPARDGEGASVSHAQEQITEQSDTRISSPNAPSGRGLKVRLRPVMRPEMITAQTYDIVPTIAAPQGTSINAIAALPDMRWVFTGGTDGYIRKYNWVDTVNSKLMLTVAQRHPFVDSVIKAGVLQSYWENEDATVRTPVKSLDAAKPISPVYSLAVEKQALWLLSGDETGAIQMQSVRFGEGERITTLRSHTSAVSVLVLAPDEKSVLSGGWDKAINDWDLNTGKVRRAYGGSASQISAIEPRPLSALPVPQYSEEATTPSALFSSNNADKPKSAGALLNGTDKGANIASEANGVQDDARSPDLDSLFGDDDAGTLAPVLGDDEDDEFSRAIASAPQQQTVEDNPLDTLDIETKAPSDTQMDIDTEPPAESQPTAVAEPSEAPSANQTVAQSLPHSDEQASTTSTLHPSLPDTNNDITPSSETTFLDASISGTLRIWDRRMQNPITTLPPRMGTPPWCMSACWSPDGNFIYAGRRNNCVEEYSLHKSLREPVRTLKLPGSSKAVSALRAMPNGRHLICASHDILRLYDLRNDELGEGGKGAAVVPFLIVPGHRTGVVSHLFLDPTGRFLISTAGNRGWEGMTTETLLGYEINTQP
ncbi:WD40 repeat-like protein [Microthyrium microscopicum]|uniref:WD40 repeat-like protein n=1 Tax=Microthyrium microscopicum TaxID=703497 RepID=A0A6A6UMI3_9PEZI|nr:WD40 repeat-like protein [Microthyrium microscopicum]